MEQKVILIIIGMSLVTYLPRMLPMVLLSKVNLPPLFLKWLQFIPIAVLSALLAPAILAPQGELSIGLDNKAFIASIPCFFVAIKTKNLFLTVVVGILSMLLLQNL